jgi:HEAT repeat protein
MRYTLPGAVAAALAFVAALHAQGKSDFGSDREISGTSMIAGKSLDQWIRDLRHPSPSVRETALHVLPQYGPAARRGMSEIIIELRDPDVSVRVNAAIAVGVIGINEGDLKKGIGALKVLMRDTEASARLQAVMAVGRIGPDAKDAIGQIAYYTIRDSAAWEIRKAAALALGNIALDPKHGPDMSALRSLSRALGDVDKEVKLQALMSLVKLGPPVYDPQNEAATKEATACKREVESRVRGITSNSDPILRIWGHMAFMRMDKVREKELKPIAALLNHADLMTRVQAAQALGTIGPEAKPVVPELVDALKDKDPMARYWVALALGSVKARPAQTVPALVETLKDPELLVRGAAARALGVLAGATRSKDAEPGLAGAIQKEGVPALIGTLKKEKEPQVGIELMWALGEIGDDAKAAIPDLERIVKDEEEALKKAAKEAINKINGKKSGKDERRTP